MLGKTLGHTGQAAVEPPFSLAAETRGDWRLLRLEGRLDAVTSPEFERLLETELSDSPPKLVLHLEGLRFVSSAGLRVFLALAKRVRNGGGDLVLLALAPDVLEIFQLAGFTQFLEIRAALDEIPGAGLPS